MKKTLSMLSVLALLTAVPAYADAEPDHGTKDEKTVPATGHGNPQDDHSAIKALDVTAEEAITTLETGLADLMAKTETSDAEGTISGAINLMSAVKTLEAASPNERQAAALKQLDQQLDGAKHAAEDKDFTKAKSATAKALSALKLYNAVK